MTRQEAPQSTEYPLLSGDKFIYDGPTVNSLGAVALIRKDGTAFAKAGLFYAEKGTELVISNDNIFTSWDDHGIITSMSITPAIRVPIPELPIIVITFETTEPEVSLEQPIRQDETVTVKDGLVYNGMPETQRLMSYGEKVSIAERYVHTPLTVWLDWVNHENRIVIASGKDKIEWVRYKQTIRLERVTELLRNPDPDSEKWRDTIVDEVHKLRYQIIESDL